MLERLAKAFHDSWGYWNKWVLQDNPEVIRHDDGSVTIPAHLVERWNRQLNTEYGDLSEKEKDSDREIAKMFLSDLL